MDIEPEFIARAVAFTAWTFLVRWYTRRGLIRSIPPGVLRYWAEGGREPAGFNCQYRQTQKSPEKGPGSSQDAS